MSLYIFLNYFFVFILGLIIGSFLNCVIYRLKTKESFLFGLSFCPHCRHRLGFWDLIPLLSFVFLKGKCRYCGSKISWQYPLVEMTTGIIFIIIFYFYQSGVILNEFFSLTYYWLVFSLLLVIFVYDLKHYIIPDEVILTSLVVIFFHHIIKDYFSLYTFSLAGIGAALFFFSIWFFSHGKWMGFGDVKLGFLIGFFLGWPAVIVALFSAFFIGAIIGIALIIFKKKKLKSEVPFGPFLIVGTFLGAFFSRAIINYYLNLLL